MDPARAPENQRMTTPLRPLPSREFDYWKANHLLNRAGFGGTPGQVRALADMGLEKAVAHIVDYEEVPDAAPAGPDEFDPDIMRPPTPEERQAAQQARRSQDEETLAEMRRRRIERQQLDRRQIRELQVWWLKRMIETPRPLEEKLALFWHGHFATSYRAIEDSYHMYLQNRMYRRHAAGSFRELLHGIIRDPAMLRYLNNDQSRREKPNENLARELMELFTLGEGNDYGEEDIKQGARALTGYTYDDDDFVGLGSQRYRQLHDAGPKRILGKTGAFDGDDFVEIILGRPVCSEFICWKLYRYFVDDRPGVPGRPAQEFILELARVFREGDYRLRPVLEAMFRAGHFYDAANVAGQVKSPIQLVVQAVRQLQVPPRSLPLLLEAADLMGQSLFFPPSVKGWEGGRTWINTSTLFVRQNLMVYLLTGRRPEAPAWEADSTRYDATGLIDHLRAPGGGVDVAEAVAYLLWFNFGRRPDRSRVDALVETVRARGGRLDNQTLVHVLSLVTAAPEYQLC